MNHNSAFGKRSTHSVRRAGFGVLAALAVTGITALAGAGAASAAPSAGPPSQAGGPLAPASRGQLVSVTPLRTLATAAAVRSELTADGFDASAVRYGVRSFRLVYRTVDSRGRPATASGLMVLPADGARQLTVVSYTHGTETYRGDAPSLQPSGFEPAPGYTFAAAGFAVSEPDYLGLGTGPGLQPYLDLPSETAAALDMLRAVRHYLLAHGDTARRDVLATGFSQGAPAALGLGRALQEGADPWFRIGALAPISGPYDLPGAEVPAITDGDLVRLNPDPQLGAKYSVLYAAFGLVALNRVYDVYSSPAQVFKPPYAGTIETLLDGNHTSEQLIAGTPGQLSDLLTARGFAMLRHPAGALAAALEADSSACEWAPRVPTRLYLATDDEQVVNANTWHCQAAFAAHGTPVTAVNLGAPDHAGSRHFGSNVAGTAQIVRWFAQLAS
jgi:hypothetical protein